MGQVAESDLQVVIDGDWVPGVLLHGLAPLPLLPERSSGWPADAVVRRGCTYGRGWAITILSVGLPTWPHDLPGRLAGALDELITRGADVAWTTGDEGCTVDPPALFDPRWMGGCVLSVARPAQAARVARAATGGLCAVTDEVLADLHHHVGDLLARRPRSAIDELADVLALASPHGWRDELAELLRGRSLATVLAAELVDLVAAVGPSVADAVLAEHIAHAVSGRVPGVHEVLGLLEEP